jgi:hypothetical protein
VTGTLTAILGYRDDSPPIAVLANMAARMASQLANGLSGDQFVAAWLAMNAMDPAENTWTAVGMDRRGYYWIEEGSRITILDG